MKKSIVLLLAMVFTTVSGVNHISAANDRSSAVEIVKSSSSSSSHSSSVSSSSSIGSNTDRTTVIVVKDDKKDKKYNKYDKKYDKKYYDKKHYKKPDKTIVVVDKDNRYDRYDKYDKYDKYDRYDPYRPTVNPNRYNPLTNRRINVVKKATVRTTSFLPSRSYRVNTVYGNGDFYVYMSYFNTTYYMRNGSRYTVVVPPVGVVLPELNRGYETYRYGGNVYYVSNGVLFTRTNIGYVVTAPEIGMMFKDLPNINTTTLSIDGNLYYECGGVVYERRYINAHPLYIVRGWM